MDNYFQTHPPKMQDGRHLTDYNSSTRTNEFIMSMNKIKRDDKYRLFLQQHGKDLMDKEWIYEKKNNSSWVNDCIFNYPTRSSAQIFIKEKMAYDSIFNPYQNDQFKGLRQCTKSRDFRLFTDSN